MIAPEYCQLMARYGRWMNERLYALLADLPDDERKRDRGAFFGSMHGTLNHLLWGDRMWLGRFVDKPCTAPAFGADMYADFGELRREREITDGELLDWAGNVIRRVARVDADVHEQGRRPHARDAGGGRRDPPLQSRHPPPRPVDDADEAGGPGSRRRPTCRGCRAS